jgi:hypothetical protein
MRIVSREKIRGRNHMKKQHFMVAAMVAISAFIVAATPAAAQTRLTNDHSTAWAHPNSGLSLPSSLGGLPRILVAELSAGAWDVIGNYETPGRSTIVSLFVYQSSVVTSPVAFDVAQRAIATNEARNPGFLGQLTPFSGITSFAPGSKGAGSGLRAVYSSSGQYKSTGVALMPFGRDWLVKIRISSKDMDAAGLDALMDKVLAELALPAEKSAQPVAAPVADCKTPMATLKKSKNVPQNSNSLADNLISSVLVGAGKDNAGEDDPKAPPKPIIWPDYCYSGRVETPQAAGSLYRVDGKTGGYLLVVSDNATAIEVGPDIGSQLMSDKLQYQVSLTEPGVTSIYISQKTLPPPEQAIDIVTKGQVKTRVRKNVGSGDSVEISAGG